MKLTRVFVASDLSESADEALRQADAWARASGAALATGIVVPEVISSSPLFPQRGQDDLGRVLDAERAAATALMERAASVTRRAAGELEVIVTNGAPESGILARAEAWGADLVVVGSRGATGLRRLLLGSVAERVVRYSHCPVLVAREGPEAGPVLGATDFSDPALPALEAAGQAAAWLGSRLSVTHCIDLLPSAMIAATAPLGATFTPYPHDLMPELRAAAKMTLETTLASTSVAAEAVVTEGHAAAAIVKLAEDLGARLIVVGTRGRTGLARLALGSVADAVVRNAPCSVLVVRLG